MGPDCHRQEVHLHSCQPFGQTHNPTPKRVQNNGGGRDSEPVSSYKNKNSGLGDPGCFFPLRSSLHHYAPLVTSQTPCLAPADVGCPGPPREP